MADNVALPPSGVTAASDEIGGVHYQRIKVGHGADGSYADVTPAAGIPITSSCLDVTGTAGASNTDLFSVETFGLTYFSYQTTGTFSATMAFQGSNDGTTWQALQFYNYNLLTWGSSVNATATFGYGSANFRYLRCRTTAYTSGTAGVAVRLLSRAGLPHNVQVQLGGPSQLIGPSAVSLTADGVATGFNVGWGAPGYTFNGTTWDRVRSATSSNGTAGTGVPGQAAMGWDGSAFRRLLCDASGNLLTTPVPGTATLSNVSASASNVTVLAANTSRKGATFYNDSSSAVYLKFGATASATSFTVKIAAGGFYELPTPVTYRGIVDGIWDSAAGAMRVTELA